MSNLNLQLISVYPPNFLLNSPWPWNYSD